MEEDEGSYLEINFNLSIFLIILKHEKYHYTLISFEINKDWTGKNSKCLIFKKWHILSTTSNLRELVCLAGMAFMPKILYIPLSLL